MERYLDFLSTAGKYWSTMAKKISLDGPAGMIKRGFDEVNDKLKDHDSRFDHVDKDMKELKYDVNEIKIKLPRLAYAIDVKQLGERVTKLEEK